MARLQTSFLSLWMLLAAVAPLTNAFVLTHRPLTNPSAVPHPLSHGNDPQCNQFWRNQGAKDYIISQQTFLPKVLQTQRRSVASVQVCGLFGLGFGEIAVILVVVGAVLGPENIGRLVKSSSSRTQEMAEELKRVPDEFQKGMEEGESEARARNAKRIRIVNEDGTPKE